ncbi:fimbria/pilus periplasmic chaperone [Pantoea tagorei]
MGTRVVYPAAEKEITVRLDNRGDQPALVQAWIDDGDPNQPVDKINVPFVMLPPVFRMEANKGQTLRIVYTGSDLPVDKESIFWLNVLDIPPKDKSRINKNQLQMAIRSRIKLFLSACGAERSGCGNCSSRFDLAEGRKKVIS